MERPKRLMPQVGTEDELHKQVVLHLKAIGADFKSDHEAGRKRTPWEQQRMKSMQSARGWADIFIAEPRGMYHGAFIELKSNKARLYLKSGKLSTDAHIQEQAEFLQRMTDKGFYSNFAQGYEDAIHQIDGYLKITKQ